MRKEKKLSFGKLPKKIRKALYHPSLFHEQRITRELARTLKKRTKFKAL